MHRLKWPFVSAITLNAAIVEPETGVPFDDELLVTVYPGLKKLYPHSLERLSFPLAQPSFTWINKVKYKYWKRPFAMGQYSSSNTTVYRMVVLRPFSGADLQRLIKPEMQKCSQQRHDVDVDCTRTGSLFFVAIGKLKQNESSLGEGDELIFLCNRETHNFTIWIKKKGQEEFQMHFTIESPLLIECIDAVFGDQNSECFEWTHP